MYTPPQFQVNEREEIARLIRRHSFATLVTSDGAAPIATHVPVLYLESGERGVLRTHMARANPQWRQFSDSREVLVIFHGPHAYISPAWYQPQVTVPTWNYAAVHAYGIPRQITDAAAILELLRETIATYEAPLGSPWHAQIPPEYLDQQIKGIVAFEIPISRWEAKFKLGQNRSSADLRGVHAALAASRDSTERALAELMREHCQLDDPNMTAESSPAIP